MRLRHLAVNTDCLSISFGLLQRLCLEFYFFHINLVHLWLSFIPYKSLPCSYAFPQPLTLSPKALSIGLSDTTPDVIQHHLMCLSAVQSSFLVKYLFRSFACFLIVFSVSVLIILAYYSLCPSLLCIFSNIPLS